MPNRDGTGPLGQGSQTGKALGSCNNKQIFQSKQSFGGGMSRRNRKGKGNRLNNSCFGRGQS